ncbi:MAG: hypothetical protein ABGY29_18310, partial [bacterium]
MSSRTRIPERPGPGPGGPPILLSPPHLSGEEAKRILAAIESNWIAPAGPDLDLFEEEVAQKV